MEQNHHENNALYIRKQYENTTLSRKHSVEVGQILGDYVARLLASNDPTTVPVPPPPTAWYALDNKVRAELVELLREAVANIRRQ